MLYILLGIIAIGVLLASEEGKALLSWINSAIWLIGSLILIVFGIIFVYSWFNSWSEDSKIALFGFFIILVLVVILSYIKERYFLPIQTKWDNSIKKKAQLSKFWKKYREMGGCIIFGFVITLLGFLIFIPIFITYIFLKY